MKLKFFVLIVILSVFFGIVAVDAVEVGSGPMHTELAPSICPDSARSSKTILDVLNEDIRFSKFKNYAELEELTANLSEENAITVFAPVNEAYETLSNDEKENLTVESLILDGCLELENMKEKTSFESLDGQLIEIDHRSDKIYFNDAEVIIPGIVCMNGVIYGIDRVPQSITSGNYGTASTEVVSGETHPALAER